jgi:hypothetical protein
MRQPPCNATLAERRAALALSPEAVAYIDGSVERSASRRLICLGDLPGALRTAHLRVASPRPADPRDLCDSLAWQRKC